MAPEASVTESPTESPLAECFKCFVPPHDGESVEGMDCGDGSWHDGESVMDKGFVSYCYHPGGSEMPYGTVCGSPC